MQAFFNIYVIFILIILILCLIYNIILKHIEVSLFRSRIYTEKPYYMSKYTVLFCD